jgi:hypothetical protein
VDNYRILVANKRLREDTDWFIATNFRNVQRGDEVYIYTGDQNLGIVGYAKVVRVDLQQLILYLNFDLDKCAALLENPIPASLVRKWVYPRAAVVSLADHAAKLEKLLPWKGNRNKPANQISSRNRVGAGFGDPVRNKEVETAAVRVVTNYFRRKGWKVESVEKLGVGFDLLCRKGSAVKKVEVKGVSGEEPKFMLTERELNAADDADFVLNVVLRALSSKPQRKTWSGSEMKKNFDFRPIQFQAALKS